MIDVRLGSIPVVEEFYGARLGADLLRTVRVTPIEQLIELADRVMNRRDRLANELRLRRHLRAGFPVARDVGLAPTPLTLNESFYFDSQSRLSVLDAPNFKQWFLFAEQLVLPDPLFTWAMHLHDAADLNVVAVSEEYEQQRAAARAVSVLIGLRPLCETSGIVLVPDPESFDPFVDDVDILGDGHTPLQVRFELSREFRDMCSRDLVLAWTVVHHFRSMPGWERRARGLDQPGDLQDLAAVIAEEYQLSDGAVWTQAHPEDQETGWQAFQRAVSLALMHRESDFSPVATSELSRSHLLQNSRIALDGVTRSTGDLPTPVAAVTLGIPSMDGVSLDDLVTLRRNEVLLADCRNALIMIADEVERSRGGGYADVQALVEEAAMDLAFAQYERLKSQARTNSRLGAIFGFGAGKAVALSLNAVASFIGGPVVPVVQRPVVTGASTAARTKVQRKMVQKHRDVHVAKTLLMSCVPSDSR